MVITRDMEDEMVLNPYEIADTLSKDMSLEEARAYAERVGNAAGEPALVVAYKDAARILDERIKSVHASCMAGSYDMGVLP